ncbi:hypothetical protein ACFQ4C_12475 [Larkinella insperata]|uniref:Replication initiation protein n=1 Tax=Larkinella insperata TaxID=332158 RepID=A0ABW3QAV8_9BACT|nr:hypothetical protein [Larkinella insperata]
MAHERLTFALPINEKTGEILNLPRRDKDLGILFALIPRKMGGYRVEIKGSLHKFYSESQNRAPLGNSNDFTVYNLLTALELLVKDYKINPFSSKLNNLEFGVNVLLPFPVNKILKSLVTYKNLPFTRDTRSRTLYYQCQMQCYIIKLYDKGHQYGSDASILRVEIKVLKMSYLKGRGIQLVTLADLLTVNNFRLLGALLVDTFDKILFDDSTINAADLTVKERNIYQNGRNPKFWIMPDDLTATQAGAHRQRLHRAKKEFRDLLERHSQGRNLQTLVSELIDQKWKQLTTINEELLNCINERKISWKTLRNIEILEISEFSV